MGTEAIRLKALVDKENNRVIFVESSRDFVDILFSFLTTPMGTIIRRTRNIQPPTIEIGCLNNLYGSVEDLDVMCLRTEACKTMLLHPRNGAETQCQNLKLKIDDGDNLKYFFCGSCTKYKLLSYYNNVSCGCGKKINWGIVLLSQSEVGFVKGLNRFVISDELQVMPASTVASLSLLSKLGLMNPNAIEEKTFDIGIDEVLNLLKCSLVSTSPLTEILLHEAVPELSKEDFDQSCSMKHQIEEHESKGNGKICVKLILSKSKKMICYAEAGEDFVDLLFSFLTVPLGFVAKEMNGGRSRGCINHLYRSVQDLDADKYFNSNDHKEILLSPKTAPGFGYENQPLGIKEVNQQYYYYYSAGSSKLTTDKTLMPSFAGSGSVFTLVDPKSPHKQATNGGGFVIGPATFMVTDNLIVTPISPVSGLFVLNKLKVPFTDIEERVVHVGNEEASRLLVASVFSKSALTDVFLSKEPKKQC